MNGYKCEECGRIFKHKENLTYHIRYTHSGIKRNYNIIHKKPKVICTKCGKYISVCVINRHLKACKGIINENYIIADSKYICNFCGKTFKKQGIKTHIWRCHTNEGKVFDPNRDYKNGMRVAWNKGLTKETDNRIKNASEKYKRNYKNGLLKSHKIYNKCKTKEYRERKSLIMRQAVLDNPDSYNGHYNRGFVKEYIYNGIKLLGSWELKFAVWCDKNNIKWIKNKDQFKYILDGKEHIYFPDFYLLDTNEYIEIKGFETDRDTLKWSQFPKDKKLKILKFKELQELGILDIISKEDLLQFMAP